MKDWKSTLISPDVSIIEAIRLIEENRLQIALVVDEKGCLLGTVTDGDVRRAILKQISLKEPVEKIMYTSSTVASINDSREKILSIMRSKEIQHLPLIDSSGLVVGLETTRDLFQKEYNENLVVLMAGGYGSRLQPLTKNCPKPMIKIGKKPILETMLKNLTKHGFYRFYISVNYHGKIIEDYFGDGSRWGVKIGYLQEEKPLGTAGSLYMLPEKPDEPILVMNSDLLTKINFRQLLEFHNRHKAYATICMKEYDLQIPYGVISLDGTQISRIDEKPLHRFFANAGVYVLNSESLQYIPQNTFYDMPDLLKLLVKEQKKLIGFPVHEYWLDIGETSNLHKANIDYGKLFD